MVTDGGESFSCSVSIIHCSTRPNRIVIKPIASEILNLVKGNPFAFCWGWGWDWDCWGWDCWGCCCYWYYY
jgi:hypothetical protein